MSGNLTIGFQHLIRVYEKIKVKCLNSIETIRGIVFGLNILGQNSCLIKTKLLQNILNPFPLLFFQPCNTIGPRFRARVVPAASVAVCLGRWIMVQDTRLACWCVGSLVHSLEHCCTTTLCVLETTPKHHFVKGGKLGWVGWRMPAAI